MRCSIILCSNRVSQSWAAYKWTSWMRRASRGTILKIYSRFPNLKSWSHNWSIRTSVMKNCLINSTRKWFIKTASRGSKSSKRPADTRCLLIWTLAREHSLKVCLGCVIPTWRIDSAPSNRWLSRRRAPLSCREWRKTIIRAKSSAKSWKRQWRQTNSDKMRWTLLKIVGTKTSWKKSCTPQPPESKIKRSPSKRSVSRKSMTWLRNKSPTKSANPPAGKSSAWSLVSRWWMRLSWLHRWT